MRDTIEIDSEPSGQLAQFLRKKYGVCWTTMDRWRRRGLLPGGTKIGRVWYWRRAAVERKMSHGE